MKRENLILAGIFCAALAWHFWCTTSNWTSGFLPGHEFRQTQTALISYYIEQDHNFTPLYETPIVGKPWVSILLEFPLYEWSVVGLARLAGVPQFEAARTISLLCFYLMLPAAYLLMGEAGLPRSRRWLALALILTCPVYIFYSRAFLMESMVLMFSVWFLLGFVRTMRERKLSWLLLCAATGTAAGLIKSTVFFVWLLPAAIFSAWCLWCEMRDRRGVKVLFTTAGYALAAALVPVVSVLWWIRLTDRIKAAHPSANLFTSHNLTAGNFGMFDLAARFSPATWRLLLEDWQQAIMPPWLIGLVLLAGLAVAREWRTRVLAAAGLFLAAQAAFPFAYALQEYYFYACAVFLHAALGFALGGLLDTLRPRLLAWLLVALPLGAQVGTYWQGYHVVQNVRSNGGSGLTDALRALTPSGSVIIVAGSDWSAVIPFYAQRKALMLRRGLDYDHDYQVRAFADLAGEEVAALVLTNDGRANRELVKLAAGRFDLDESITFSHVTADVYLSKKLRQNALQRLAGRHGYDHITTLAVPDTGPNLQPVLISPALAAGAFHRFSPAPSQYRFAFGLSLAEVAGVPVLGAHPDSELWIPTAPGPRRIEWQFGLMPGAYERDGDKTDGVEFVIAAESAQGIRRELYRRVLDPVHLTADRGLQRVSTEQEVLAGETLVFMSRPHGSYSFDWAYWAGINIR